jgi:hypothetical protein
MEARKQNPGIAIAIVSLIITDSLIRSTITRLIPLSAFIEPTFNMDPTEYDNGSDTNMDAGGIAASFGKTVKGTLPRVRRALECYADPALSCHSSAQTVNENMTAWHDLNWHPVLRGDACLFCRKRKLVRALSSEDPVRLLIFRFLQRCDAAKPSCNQCTKAKKEFCEYDLGKPKSRVKILEAKIGK